MNVNTSGNTTPIRKSKRSYFHLTQTSSAPSAIESTSSPEIKSDSPRKDYKIYPERLQKVAGATGVGSSSSPSDPTGVFDFSHLETSNASPTVTYTTVFFDYCDRNTAYYEKQQNFSPRLLPQTKDFNLKSPRSPSGSDFENPKRNLEHQYTPLHDESSDTNYSNYSSSVASNLCGKEQYAANTSNVFSRSKHHSFREKSMKQKCRSSDYEGCAKSNRSGDENKVILKRCRKSTSDLTDMENEDVLFTPTNSKPSSPRSKSFRGGLAYLASRRGSRESVSNEDDIAPLNNKVSSVTRQRRTSNFLELPVPDYVRPRVNSLPEKSNCRLDDLYRLRHFSITTKGGVVNCGDEIINRRSKSNTSVNSTASKASNVSGERSPFDGSCCGSGYHTVESSPLDTPEEYETPKYRVVLLGQSGTGKTALVSQFMTSDYMNTYDASLDEEFGEKSVSILLDEEESEMIFIDHPASEMSVENSLSTYEPHACIVVYSVTDKASHSHVEETLNYLWREGFTKEKSVIVVGNKADLERARTVSAEEGKSLATSRDCKFIETSSGIQHNVDELLVGILKQIRLKEAKNKKAGAKHMNKKLSTSKTSLRLNIAREILQKICMNDLSKSKSCENLYVL